VARIEEGRNATGFGGGNLKEEAHLEDLGIDGRLAFI
jgi:hypothetical protein